VFYPRIFDKRLPEDDLKKVQTCRGLSGMYVKVYILVLSFLLVLSIKEGTVPANHESPLTAQREMKLSEI
jgi:hypothetical protein